MSSGEVTTIEAPRETVLLDDHSVAKGSVAGVFGASLRLGLISFGGPVAHLGYFRQEYVARRRWIDDATYADLVALCQFLPGPASSQVGIGIGILRAGRLGGLAAFLGFTLPSAVIMTAFAYGVHRYDVADSGWIHGLKVVAVAVVAQAVWAMSRQFCRERVGIALGLLAALTVLLVPTAAAQVGVMVAAGLVGLRLLPTASISRSRRSTVPLSRCSGITAWVAFFALLFGATIVSRTAGADGTIALFSRFYRAGALVFGGGHVVLPLLQAQVVAPGWLTDNQFLAGYGAAQALPGPLFTFSAYLGAIREPEPNGVAGATVALLAIFLPAILLVYGSLPFWDSLRSNAVVQRALRGVNAAVVGILLAALYDPVWKSAILRPTDIALAVACLGLLMYWKFPPWSVVIIAAVSGEVLSRVV